MKCNKLLIFILFGIFLLAVDVYTLNLSPKTQELFIQCIKLKEQLKNDNIKCETILMNDQKEKINENMNMDNQNANSFNDFSEDFERILNRIDKEMKNLDGIKIEVNGLKNKMKNVNVKFIFITKNIIE